MILLEWLLARAAQADANVPFGTDDALEGKDTFITGLYSHRLNLPRAKEWIPSIGHSLASSGVQICQVTWKVDEAATP